MRWEKIGRILAPNSYPFLGGYASNPSALKIDEGLFKVYFNFRDRSNRAHISNFILDLKTPTEIRDITTTPVLSPGKPGLFDDSGVSLGCLVKNGKKILMYYVGWNLSQLVPWRNSIGLAISSDGGISFQKHSLAPVLDRSETDPFSLSYPFVYKNNTSWHMWYGSNRNWGREPSTMDHILKLAVSQDGIHWTTTGEVAFDHVFKDEFAIAKPSIITHNNHLFMWYSYRGNKYKIGMAHSNDGYTWTRTDNQVGISADPKNEWESESICYPHVFKHQQFLYMIYVGNNYGQGGLGLARMSVDTLKTVSQP